MINQSIDAEAHIGAVTLAVNDLDRSKAFYEEVLGFRPLAEESGAVALRADVGRPLIRLVEEKSVVPKPGRSTGLYHFAILVPSRLELARSLQHLIDLHYPLQGASDHLVSEALYLADPDGNGIEIYRDRPRADWKVRNGTVAMATDPFDFQGVLGELKNDSRTWEGLASGTTIGHIHLHVGHIGEAKAFYCDVLGFDVVASMTQALFVSAGGYHHHIGLNTWAGVGAPAPPANSVGLRRFEIVVSTAEELQRLRQRIEEMGIPVEAAAEGLFLRDPSHNPVALIVG